MRVLAVYCPQCGELSNCDREWSQHPRDAWIGAIYVFGCMDCDLDFIVLTDGDPFGEEIVMVFTEANTEDFMIQCGYTRDVDLSW